MDYFISTVTEAEIKREKEKARRLKKTQWWKRRCAEGVCYFCRRRVPSRELTLDHVVPLIRGGKSTRGNVVPACKECNNKKKYLLPVDWQEYLGKIRQESLYS
ncbi:MAG: HNH endonuclease [Nitrospira sp.]|nr:HNH endonuclease [Nitrospira sp.]